MDSGLNISGDNLLHALDYVKRKKGTDGLDEIVKEAGLGIDDFYPDMMYPLEIYINLLQVIQKQFNESDSNVISRLGYDRAKNLSFFEYLKDKSDPVSIFQMIEKNWDRFNSFGKIQVRQEDWGATIFLCEFDSNPLYCQRMKGFLEGIITAICSRKGGKVEEEACQVHNGKYCKFKCSWKKEESW